MAGNYAKRDLFNATVPLACQREFFDPDPSSSPSCYTTLYNPVSTQNKKFALCCREYSVVPIEPYGKPNSNQTCMQNCKVKDFAAEKEMYHCLTTIAADLDFKCTGHRDSNGNFSSTAPARSLSLGGLLVAGLALVGMLSV